LEKSFSRNVLETFFPTGKHQVHENPYGKPIFYTYEIPGSEINERRGIRVLFNQSWKTPSPVKQKFTTQRFLITPEEWVKKDAPSLLADIKVDALLYVPKSDPYQFQLQGGFKGKTWVNNAMVMPATPAKLLVQGWNQLRVDGRWTGMASLKLTLENC